MPEATDTALSVLHFFNPPEEFSYLTRDDPAAFAPPPSFGPFRVLHQVGVGALGPVFRTYEPTRDRLVAVKVFRLDITPEQAQSLAEALTFAAEAGLFHPSVVEPIAAGVEGTVAYRAEEYVAAESLDVALRHYAPAAVDKVLPFITQLAGAIDFARAAGVGHGALHPRDIFVTPDEARATGFGVVEALERVGLRAPVRRPYSAPERVEGREWSTPADVFSLAAITYELLTARRPAGTGPQIGSLGEFGGERADALHAVLAQAMDDDPAKRFGTALSFASALEAAAHGKPQPGLAAPAVAAAATPVSDDQVEDSVGVMPPLIGVDDHEEPAEASIEEDVFRADQRDLDDVAIEEEGDALDFALRPEEVEAEDEPEPREDLLDHEAVDLALPPKLERFASDFEADAVDEPELDEDEEVVEPPRAAIPVEAPSRGYSSITEPPLEVEQQRSLVLPIVMAGILCLLLGFGAGYVVRGRNAELAAPVTQTPPTTAAAPTPSEKEFSEQTVAPPAPPKVPAAEPRPAPAAPRPTTPASPRATRPSTGSITIRSTPPNAVVTVDGEWRGRTPLALENLKFGSYTIRIVQDGFAVDRHVVPLSAQSPARTITSKLQRLPGTTPPARPQPQPKQQQPPPPPQPQQTSGTGSLFVNSNPTGARVILDGKPVGTTPLQLKGIAAGTHAVQLELPNYQTWRTSTTILPGRQARVSGSLEPIR